MLKQFKPLFVWDEDKGGAGGAGDNQEVKKPEKTLADVEKEMSAKMEEQRAKYEKDISALKSKLDTNFAEAEKKWKAKEAEYQKLLDEMEDAGADEESKPKLREKRAEREKLDLQRERDEARQQLQERQQIDRYTAFFGEKGIASSELVLDQGLEALVASGWKAVDARLAELGGLKKEKAEKGNSAEDKSDGDGKDEDEVLLQKTGGKGGKGWTWEAARKRFGTDEDVYQAYEQGTIDQLPE